MPNWIGNAIGVNSVYIGSNQNLSNLFQEYYDMVIADGGEIDNTTDLKGYINMAKSNGIYDSIQFGMLGAYNIRTSGNTKYVTKGYDMTPTEKLGDELVVNGGFENWTGDNPANWLVTNEDASNYITEDINGARYVHAGTGSNLSLQQSNVVSLGKSYLITIDVEIITGQAKIQIGSSAFNYVLSNGVNIVRVYSSLGNLFQVLRNNAAIPNEFIIKSFYAKEILDTDYTATQTTEANQPYLTGFIAPNEKWGLKNPNGGVRYMTHPTISFAANEAWSVSTVINHNSSTNVNARYCGGNGSSALSLKNTDNFVHVINKNSLTVKGTESTIPFFGKNKIITFVANGDGTVDYFIDGFYIEQLVIDTTFDFNIILNGRSVALDMANGSISAHFIRNIALTPTQVATEATKLRQIFPEIPSVTIGSQTWATSNCEMVATPMGNAIANITANANVEKITNIADREFSSDTGFWTKTQATISGGVCTISTPDGSYASIIRAGVGIVGNWYKISFDILSINNPITVGFQDTGVQYTTTGNKVQYTKCLSSTLLEFKRSFNSPLTAVIDNVSVQEVGWSDSQNLYDAIYSQTSGTVEQKTYEAVKAAAMWCYYNNDLALGAIYGKLYNWFAVKLLQMDIDYYNAANPSTPWGWRVPTQTDFNTLATTLGGISVAGGKMKVAGTDYINSPNTGADNSSGFSLVIQGYRSGGFFVEFGNRGDMWCIDKNRARVSNNNANLETSISLAGNEERGQSLRLIKS